MITQQSFHKRSTQRSECTVASTSEDDELRYETFRLGININQTINH